MKLEIEGYQSIENKIEIEIEGLTVITGESNIGKSASIRAFQGLLDSQAGVHFINKHESQSSVTVYNRGHKATWLKDKKTTTYYFDNVEIKKAGKTAPKELDKLGFFEVTAQAKYYRPQVQSQFDPIFILSEASPAVAAELLSASKQTAVLTKALKGAQKSANALEANVEFRDKLYKEVQEKRTKAEPFKERLVAKLLIVKNAVKLQEDLQDKINTRSILNTSYKDKVKLCDALKIIKTVSIPNKIEATKITQLMRVNRDFQINKRVYGATKEIKQIALAPLNVTTEKLKQLRQLKDKYNSWLNIYLKTQNSVQVSKDESPISLVRLHTLKNQHKQHKEIVLQLAETERGIKEVTEEISKLESEKSQILKDLGQCPLCGSKTGVCDADRPAH